MQYYIETNGKLFRVVGEASTPSGLYRTVRGVYNTIEDAKKALEFAEAYDPDNGWTRLSD